MFTGIVRGCGTVQDFKQGKQSWRLSVKPPQKFPKIKTGGSISVNGACLTLVDQRGEALFFDVIAETVRRTNLSGLKKGARVNLEPALLWNDRIEGHFVQGHVDAVGLVKKITEGKADVCFEITYPRELKTFLIEKGSVTVNGVSLTVGRVLKTSFELFLIPHTLKLSNFRQLKAGDAVNLEADILAKFLSRMIDIPRRAV